MTPDQEQRGQFAAAAQALVDAHPQAKFVDAFIADLNGVLRGKRLPAASARKLFENGLKMPRSLVGVDIWGADVLSNGLVLETGDCDGVCVAAGPLQIAPHTAEPGFQLLMMMTDSDGAPFAPDPRQALVTEAERLAAHGLTAVAAVELEFYLFSAETDAMGRPTPPPRTGAARRIRDGRVYAMDEIEAYAGFFDALYAACETLGLPVDTSIVEAGPGQFEVNLKHQSDVVRAADQALLLRRAVKGVASKLGLMGSFMAKPFIDEPGSGQHVHMSFIDRTGRNAFDDGSDKGGARLGHAVAGLIASAPEAMIFLAPHSNSYRRFRDGSHAPTRAGWAYENRTAAIRIPNDSNANRRFEHRIAGADANPYLVLAAILAGARHGLEQKLKPPAPLDGNAYESDAPRLPNDWAGALHAFEDGKILSSAFGPLFTRVYGELKRQEMRFASDYITDLEYDAYLTAF